ncbi:hypothetical protein HK101_008169 [Irineochytrium annulatum]|nr:hypothetical protein HK101_008169 [Irineochytrium annulatum]
MQRVAYQPPSPTRASPISTQLAVRLALETRKRRGDAILERKRQRDLAASRRRPSSTPSSPERPASPQRARPATAGASRHASSGATSSPRPTSATTAWLAREAAARGMTACKVAPCVAKNGKAVSAVEVVVRQQDSPVDFVEPRPYESSDSELEPEREPRQSGEAWLQGLLFVVKRVLTDERAARGWRKRFYANYNQRVVRVIKAASASVLDTPASQIE